MITSNCALLQAIKSLPRKHKNDRYGQLSRENKFEKKLNIGYGLPKTPISDKKLDAERKINREIAIMKKLDHAHVVKRLEVLADKTGKSIYIGTFSCYVSSVISR